MLGEGDVNVSEDGQSRSFQSHFEFSKIEEEDVLRLLCSLDPNKAVGVDKISAKLL